MPLREIALQRGEPPFRVYDPSGPYTDAAAEIDVAAGLPRLREAWVKEPAGRDYDGREVRPEDNGNVIGEPPRPRVSECAEAVRPLLPLPASGERVGVSAGVGASFCPSP